MNKKKLFAVVISLALVIGVVLPGTLALSTDQTSSNGTIEVPTETTTPAPDTTETPVPEGTEAPAETPTEEPVKTCTCDPQPAEGETHREGCPLYVDTTAQDAKAFYNAIMACSSIEEVDAAIAQFGNDKSMKLYEALSVEEKGNLEAHIQTLHEAYLETLVIEIEQPAGNYSNVASFRELLAAMQASSQLRRAPRAATQNSTEGLELAKSVTDNHDGTYTINLEAYTTGEIKTSTGVKPVDIVLLVDMSTSMKNNFSDSGYAYTEVYASDLSEDERYYVKAGNRYVTCTWCDTCEAWTDGCTWFFVHIGGNKYTPKKSSEDATQGSVQFYTRESVQSMTRLEALKKAATSFITDVADKGNNRIAIVGFHDYAVSLSDGFHDATTDETILKNAINGIGPNDLKAATDHDDALEAAEALFQGSDTSAAERQRVVVLFTDGEPEPLNDGDWSSATVRDAVESAYRLKNTYAAAVYCISVAPGTDAASMSSPMDKYMSYVSSNYPNARYTGSQITPDNWESEPDYEQRVVNQITPGAQADISKGSFYLSASSMSALQNIFQQIASQTGGSSISLGSSAVVKDIVTPYFNMPDNASNVTVQAIDCLSYVTATGEATWGTTGTTLTEAVTIEGSQIGVTGFDFDRNFVSETGRVEDDVTQAGDFHGRKLVISFTITPKKGFLGGNGVPTNESAGIYASSDATEPLATATVDPVDVAIEKLTVTTPDANVYLGAYLLENVNLDNLKDKVNVKIGDVELNLTRDNFGLASWQNEYVDISIELKDENGKVVQGFENMTKDQNYSITVKVEPKITGTVGGTTQTGSGTIHVFKPEITYKDGEVYYGADIEADLDNGYRDNTIVWRSGDKTSTDTGVTMTGTEPTLTFTYAYANKTDVSDGKYNTKQDIPVNVTVKEQLYNQELPQSDITQYTTFLHTACAPACGWNETTLDGTPAFLLHVKTCQLTVRKTGGASDEPYVFTVYRNGKEYSEVTVVGNTSETIYELPVGTYKIKEDTGWSWRYDAGDNGSAKLTASAPSGSIACSNSKTENYWLNGFSDVVKNIFGTNH